MSSVWTKLAEWKPTESAGAYPEDDEELIEKAVQYIESFDIRAAEQLSDYDAVLRAKNDLLDNLRIARCELTRTKTRAAAYGEYASPVRYSRLTAAVQRAGGWDQRLAERLKRTRSDAFRAKTLAELNESKEQCRRLAAEIERLSTQSKPTDMQAAIACEFVEVARLALSESTFARLYERSRDRVSPRRAKP